MLLNVIECTFMRVCSTAQNTENITVHAENGLLKTKTALHYERRRFGGDGGNRTHLKLVFIG